ncbi:TIGR00341 family protein [Candidatus Dojkabacteria bacterium]|uniref:TIGR00341 family protein n=1 Tax=Candidatus Dojkabacteria bacterium TaxID=2099670 RepID=A0A955RKQ4_9BACT|nr:TIGR00341 family protein [Candidatus Dojkabacteria bacterium]
MSKDIDDLGRSEIKKLQSKLVETISDEVNFKTSYFLLLISSAIIATFGLLNDTVAVVIGAMLIAPLFSPVMGITVGVLTTRRHLLRKSATSLFISIGVTLFVAAVITFITPDIGISQEILARTNPTIIDLLIALASSVIGVSALYYPKISSSATGVAVSIALLPPLCASGIGIALGSWEIFWGAFLLFLANIAAIVFAGVITLYILKFRPHRDKEEKRFAWGLSLSFIFLVILAVPLTIYLRETIQQSVIRNQVLETLREELSAITPDAKLDKTNILFIPTQDSTEIGIEATAYLPEGTYLTVSQQKAIVEKISQTIDSPVELDLNIVDTILLRRQEDEQLQKLQKQFEEQLESELLSIQPGLIIDKLGSTLQKSEDGSIESAEGFVQLRQDPENPSISFEEKELLEWSLQETFKFDVHLLIEFIPTTQLRELTEDDFISSITTNSLTHELRTISDKIVMDPPIISEIDSDSIHVIQRIYIPTNVIITKEYEAELEKKLDARITKNVSLTLQIVSFTEPITVE